MKTQDVFEYFVTKKNLASKLGYTAQAFYNWGEYPPEMVQYKLETITEGRLKRTPGTGERPLRRKRKA
jgi:hypothetical protein